MNNWSYLRVVLFVSGYCSIAWHCLASSPGPVLLKLRISSEGTNYYAQTTNALTLAPTRAS